MAASDADLKAMARKLNRKYSKRRARTNSDIQWDYVNAYMKDVDKDYLLAVDRKWRTIGKQV